MRRFLLIGISLFAILALVLLTGYLWLSSEIPPLESLKNYRPALTTRVYDRNGNLLAEFGEEERELVGVEELPPHVIYAFLAAEDANFFEHRGLDYPGILRAFWKNLTHARIVQGGSTITQQVAKTFFLTPERKLVRKLREILLALKLERNLSKEEILYLYLNQIYFGRGAYGIAAAARNYFQKDPRQLTLAEAALLAGLPRAPNRGAPHRDPAYARSRQLYVLEQMLRRGWIKKGEYERAVKEVIRIPANPSPFWQAPYAADLVRQWLVSTFGEEAVEKGGLIVYTTFDLGLSRIAQKAVRNGVREVDRRQGFRGAATRVSEGERNAWLEQEREKLFERLSAEGLIPAVAVVGEPSFRLTLNDAPQPLTSWIPLEFSFPGVVTGFDARGEFAWVLTPLGLGRLPKAGVTSYTTEKDPSRIHLRKLFSPGDLITVKRLDPQALKDPRNPRRSILPLWDPHEPGAMVLEFLQDPEPEAALLCAIPETGEILAVVGGKDYQRSQFNRAFQAVRQPGSAFKPIVYAAALEQGFTPVTRVSDTPVVYQDVEHQTQWKPRNFEEKFFGDLLLFQALALSRNVVTLQIAIKIGMDPILDMAKRLGIEGELPRNLTIALGSQGVTLRELLRVYATFHNLGRRPDLFFIREVWDLKGNRLYAHLPPSQPQNLFLYKALDRSPPPVSRETLFAIPSYPRFSPVQVSEYPEVISPPVAYMMTFLLRQVVERGTGWRLRALARPVAGKTGTTDNYNDAWFIGYVPSLITGVWVGRDDAKPLGPGEVGGKAAAPIWLEFMKEALSGEPVRDFPIPEGITFEKVDPRTGRQAGIFTEKYLWVPFPEGVTPQEFREEENLPQLSVDPFATFSPQNPPPEEEE